MCCKPAEVAALLDRIPATTPLELRDRALFELAYASGLRAEELVSLDVDVARLRLRDRAGRGQGRQDAAGAGRRARAARRSSATWPARPPGARRGDGDRARCSCRSRAGGSAPRTSGAGCAPGPGRPRRSPRRSPTPIRTPCATRSRPICWRAAPTCGAIQELLGHASDLDDPGLHSGRVGALAISLRARPSAGLTLQLRGTHWKRTSKRSSCKICGGATRPPAIERARERLVVAYSPLVKYVAGRMSSGLPAHVEEADLISYGLGGLISAIERFDLIARDQVRDLRDHADPRRDHRRAAHARLGPALGARPRPRVRARQHEARGSLPAGARPTRRWPTELEISVDEFQDALLQISNSTIVALDELWNVSDSSGDQVSLLDTLPDRGAPDPAGARRPVRAARSDRRRDRRPARAREARRRPLLLREPDPARDRRGPRRDRVARLPAAHQGRAAAALQARGRTGLTPAGRRGSAARRRPDAVR